MHFIIIETISDIYCVIFVILIKDVFSVEFFCERGFTNYHQGTTGEIAEICRGKALFFVNDRLDIALAAGADGVHVGQSDLPAAVVRSLVPKDFLVGVSVGSVAEALAAEADGADYVAVSPVFSTASKHDAGDGHGLDTARDICDAVSVPVVGIGGLNKDNIPEVIAAGIDGIAVISAVVSQEDISASAAELSAIIAEAKRSV